MPIYRNTSFFNPAKGEEKMVLNKWLYMTTTVEMTPYAKSKHILAPPNNDRNWEMHSTSFFPVDEDIFYLLVVWKAKTE
jgi:hypothetical protein